MNTKKIYFTEKDYEILNAITERYSDRAYTEFLEGELDRGEVVGDDQIPSNVVTLRSRARIYDSDSRTEKEVTVVPPEEAKKAGNVSVLSPLGVAIIGLSEGQTIQWPMQGGRIRRFQVTKVVHQPKADERDAEAA